MPGAVNLPLSTPWQGLLTFCSPRRGPVALQLKAAAAPRMVTAVATTYQGRRHSSDLSHRNTAHLLLLHSQVLEIQTGIKLLTPSSSTIQMLMKKPVFLQYISEYARNSRHIYSKEVRNYEQVLLHEPPPRHLKVTLQGQTVGVTPGLRTLAHCSQQPWWASNSHTWVPESFKSHF